MNKKKAKPSKAKKVQKNIGKKQKKKTKPKPSPKYVVLLKNPTIAQLFHYLAFGYVARRKCIDDTFEYISLAEEFLSCESPVNGPLKWNIHTIDFSITDYWEILFPISPKGIELVYSNA